MRALILIPLGALLFLLLTPSRARAATITRTTTYGPNSPHIPPTSVANTKPPGGSTVTNKPPPTSAPPTTPQRAFNVGNLLNLIARAEANNSYDSYYARAPIRPAKRVSLMTVQEVRDWQERNKAAGAVSTAVGRYQFISNTLQGLISQTSTSPNALFNSTLQDAFAMILLRRRGLDAFLAGTLTPVAFARNLSQEWAGLPKDASNLSYYHGQAGNRATVDFASVISVLTGA